MKVLNKIMNKNNLPILLFIVLFINYVPLMIKNVNSKLSNAVETQEMTICFIVEIILLTVFFIKKVKFTKKIRNHLIILTIITDILILIQLVNYINGTCEILDFANILCIAINIILFFILISEMSIDENYISCFFKYLVCMGLVACLANVHIYVEEILQMLGIKDGIIKVYGIKSFFAHRNQFANFLYLCIIANFFLILKAQVKSKKIIYLFSMLALVASLIVTASRTGLVSTILFFCLYFSFTQKIHIKTKIIIAIVAIIVASSGTFIVSNNSPEIVEMFSTVFIREKSIHNFTGRTKLWDTGVETITQNIFTFLFGVGRFVGIELLEKYDVTQFHSFYIDAMVAGGIMELAYLLAIYIIVIRKILKSDLNRKYKSLYLATYISYAVYCGFESLGRFSIGCGDTAYLIFLISIPLLHANSVKEKDDTKEKIKGDKKLNFKELKNKYYNLPVILFIVILINFIPVICVNIFSKNSNAVSTLSMASCFVIELIILAIYLYKKVKISEEIKKEALILVSTTVVLGIVQVASFFTKDFIALDVVNIGCIFLNILILFIIMINMKADEKHIYLFFKLIVYMSLIACAVNFIVYFKEISQILTGARTGIVFIKSFFANRNQFAFFLYTGIISSVFLIFKYNQRFEKICLGVFIVNLILTMSRTGLIATVVFCIGMFFISGKISKRTKIIVVVSLIVLAIIVLLVIRFFVPSIWKFIDSHFLRINNLADLSGRAPIWKIGIEKLNGNIFNYLFGIGRFKSIQNLSIGEYVYTQYHNIYLDFLITGGIMELAYFIYIFYIVIKKVLKSDLDKKYIQLYKIMFITYFIYICFESFGRFSIGCSDTLCFVFFITIPLLHANSSVKDIKKLDKGEKQEE